MKEGKLQMKIINNHNPLRHIAILESHRNKNGRIFSNLEYTTFPNAFSRFGISLVFLTYRKYKLIIYTANQSRDITLHGHKIYCLTAIKLIISRDLLLHTATRRAPALRQTCTLRRKTVKHKLYCRS